MIQSRAQFGYLGVVVPTAAVIATFLVFNVLDLKVLEDGMHGLYGVNGTIVVIVASIIAAAVAIYGHDVLHQVFQVLFWISVPVYLVLSAGIVTVASTRPRRPRRIRCLRVHGRIRGLGSYNVTLPRTSRTTPDISRQTPVPRRSSSAVTGGASLSAVWLMAMGAWLATRLGATDGLVGLHSAGNKLIGGLGSLLAVLSIIGLVTVVGINTYSAVIGVATVADSFRPVRPTARCASS